MAIAFGHGEEGLVFSSCLHGFGKKCLFKSELIAPDLETRLLWLLAEDIRAPGNHAFVKYMETNIPRDIQI